jgi:outer membrane protein
MYFRSGKITLLVALAWLLVGQSIRPAWAGYEVARIPTDNLPPGSPGLGIGMRMTRDVYIGQERTPDIVPLYIYEGNWLFAHGTSAGLHVFKNETFTLDLLARYRFEAFDPDQVPGLEALQQRRQTVDGGISGGMRGKWGALELEYVIDLKDRHDGNELDISYRYPMQMGAFSLSPFITLSFLDDELANYYYGVTEEESQAAGIPAYAPGASSNISLGVATSWQISQHIFAFGNVGLEFVDQNIEYSPIVGGDIGATAFVGAGYFFGPVSRSKYVNEERKREWSWRVNYGYTGEHNIVYLPMQGNLEKSSKVDTNIAGFTLGKLLQDGQRVDVYGKVALFRHIEEPLQDDFWSYAAYVMLIGKGYVPWSDKVAFRWGFGAGASYAQKIPSIELVKAQEKDRNNSKLLNYLEFTVDFPIDGIIKSKLARNCYVGLVVNHRSGLFESSDMLGQVTGGSDWYTVSLECLR